MGVQWDRVVSVLGVVEMFIAGLLSINPDQSKQVLHQSPAEPRRFTNNGCHLMTICNVLEFGERSAR